MSDGGCLHLHEGDKHVGYICQASGQRYIARTRWAGYQKYDIVGKPSKAYAVAVKRMAVAFAASNAVKRADVLLMADYYDPVQLCELVRR